MKKINIIIPIVTAIVGFIIGFMLFNSTDNKEIHTHKTTEIESETWTCSMHPQIRMDEAGDCPICGMDLISAKQEDSQDLSFEMTQEAIALANIQTLVIGEQSTSSNSSLSLNGKIQVNETAIANLSAHIPGRIEKLYISFTGEKVNKGQKIADIYSPELITAQKELLEAQKVMLEHPKLFEATKNKLRFLKINATQIEHILSSKYLQENFSIYADYSGVVKTRKVSIGDHIMTGQVLFEIQNLDKLWVLFDVYENDLNKIKKGSKISFKTAGSNEVHTAKISFVDPAINPKTRTAAVRAELNNKNKTFKPEMFVTGILKSNSEVITALTIPKTAILWTGERSVVYLKLTNKEHPTFEYKEIVLGESIGNNYIVKEGISIGDEIVVNGAFVIDASAQLKNKTSMMNRNVDVIKSLKTNKTGKEYTSAFICPMRCEGSGSEVAGECPVCGMKYVKNKIDNYSCPMHKEITGKKGDKCPKCGMNLTPSKTDEHKVHNH
jgi:Cu(I)/Ag(I) efflux system membrane fusion protein